MSREISTLLALLLVAGACSVSSEVSRELGAQCLQKQDCDERCLQGEDFPDGLCSVSCERNGDCPSSAACVDVEGGVCLFRCPSGNSECEFLGQGWSCQMLGERADGQEVAACIGN